MSPNAQREDKEEEVLRRVRRDLHQRDEGGAIYLRKSELTEFGFEPGQEVDVEYVIRDGSIKLEASADTRGGFNKEEMLDFAMTQNWSRLHGLDSDGDWAYTFKDESGDVTIEIDSHMRADDEILENISVVGPSVALTEELEKFDRLAEAAREDSTCRIEIRDSDAIWEQFKGANVDEDIPDRDIVRQLVDKADTVTARLVATRPSVLTPLDDLQELVETIRERTHEIDSDTP